MTTVASDLKKIVTDSSVNDGDQVWEDFKAERLNGSIFAMAGTASDMEKFMAWLRREKRGGKPKVEEDFTAMELNSGGLFLYDETLARMRLHHPHAIGSGAKGARVAMMCGKTVEEAVELACKVDSGSRLPIQVYELEENKQ